MSRTMRSGTGSGQRGHFAADEEVAVDAPKMDCLGGVSPSWASGLGRGLALSVLPRTAKLVMLHVISNEKENLRAEVDAADEGDGLQVEVIPFHQDDQPHPASKRNKHLRLSQPTNHALETITDGYKRFPFVGPSPTRIPHPFILKPQAVFLWPIFNVSEKDEQLMLLCFW